MGRKEKYFFKIIFFYIIYIIIIVFGSFILFEVGVRLQIVFFDKNLSTQLEKAKREIPPPVVNGCVIPFENQASLGSIVQPSIYPDIVYGLKPNIKACFYNSLVVTNNSGLRANKNYQKPKPKDVYRILLLGDSQTFGQGVFYEETFGYYLEKNLENIIPHKRIEVINTGVPGYNTAMEAAYLKEYGMQYEPDCIVILFIDNDLGLPWLMRKELDLLTFKKLYIFDFLSGFKNIYQPDEEWFNFPPDSFTDYVSEKDRKRVPEKYRHMVGITGYKQALVSIINSVGSKKIPVINLLNYDTFNSGENSDGVVDLQQELGIMMPSFELPQSIEYTLSKKDLHLNSKGHQEIGRQILQILIRDVFKK